MAVIRMKKVINKPISKKAAKRACARRTRPVIVNIDESDKHNELAQVEYVDEIYSLYRLRETEGSFHDYMDSQPNINPTTRARLWLIQVHTKCDLTPETLYLAVNVFDRFLSVVGVPVDKTDLPLFAIAALFISSKYEEDLLFHQPRVDYMLTFLSEEDSKYYSRDHLLAAEKSILTRLDWYLSVPTPYVFTMRYTKASLPYDNYMEDLAFYFTKVALMDYSLAVNTIPSKMAAAAVYAARCTLNKTPVWNQTLHYYCEYSEGQLTDIANKLIANANTLI